MYNYLQPGGAVVAEPEDLDYDPENDDPEDNGTPADAGSDPWLNQQAPINFGPTNLPPAYVDNYQTPFLDDQDALANSDATFAADRSGDQGADYGSKPISISSGASARLNPLQRIVQLATSRPGAMTATSPNGKILPLPEALSNLSGLNSQYPERNPPNLLERVAAGALGAAAGYSNAARRAAPINIPEVTQNVLEPGYQSKLAQWQSRVVPAQQAVQLASEQVQAQRAAELNAANIGLKGAQAEMNIERAKFYGDQAGRGLVQVTPTMEQMTGGALKAGTTVPQAWADTAFNDAMKSNPSNSIANKVQQLHAAFPDATPDEIWQAVVNPSQVGKPDKAPNEAQVKDNQIKAAYASALGKDPATVSEAEMEDARRMFGTGDPAISAGIRAFVARNKRVPTPQEEEGIINNAISLRANARTPVSELPKTPEIIGAKQVADEGKILQQRASAIVRLQNAQNINDPKERQKALDLINATAVSQLQGVHDTSRAARLGIGLTGDAVQDYQWNVDPKGNLVKVPRVQAGANPQSSAPPQPAAAPSTQSPVKPAATPSAPTPPTSAQPKITPLSPSVQSSDTYTDPVSKKTYSVGQVVDINRTPVRIAEIRNGVPHGLPVYKVGDIVSLQDGKHRVNAVDSQGNALSVEKATIQ